MNSEREMVVTVKKKPLNIHVIGNRDPRGYDNTVRIWLDNNDQLHIRVWKADRCYKFKKEINTSSFTETIQS